LRRGPNLRGWRSAGCGHGLAGRRDAGEKQAQDFRLFRFHDLRHLHAVNWVKSGRSIYVLQQRLGHTSVKTTEIYLQFLTPEEKQAAMFGRVEQRAVSAL
jgi:integrase/recombinase XerD